MPRPCQRVRLECGLRLDLNCLARRGLIRLVAAGGPVGIRWSNGYSGNEIASGLRISDLTRTHVGYLHIQIGRFEQQIHMVAPVAGATALLFD
jgi:hypothetical protein